MSSNAPEPEGEKVTETEVRGITLRLVGYTRALELGARMNRETEVLDFIDGIKGGEIFYDLGACEGRFALYAALFSSITDTTSLCAKSPRLSYRTFAML